MSAAAAAPSYGLPADTLPATVQAGLQTYPNGAVVPKLTPSVAAATADHLRSKGSLGLGYGSAPLLATSGSLLLTKSAPILRASTPILTASAPIITKSYPLADSAPAVVQGGLQTLPNGAVVPALTPSVAAATAEHLRAKGSLGYGAAPIAAAPIRSGYGGAIISKGLPLADSAPAVVQGGLQTLPNGAVVPALTPSVAAATAQHLAAKANRGW